MTLPIAFQAILVRKTILQLAVRALPAIVTLALLSFTVALAMFATTARVDTVACLTKVALLTHACAFSALAMHTVSTARLDIAGLTHVAHFAKALTISACAVAGAVVWARLALTEIARVAIVAHALLVLAATTTVAILVAGVSHVARLSSYVRVPASATRARFRSDLAVTAHTVDDADQ